MTEYPDEWDELCLIGITKENGSEVQFAALTEEISFDMASKDIESKAMANGGCRIRRVPQGDNVNSITFKMTEVNAGLDGSGIIQWLHPQSPDDTTDPILVTSSLARNRHKIVLLWSETLPAAASTSPALGKASYRKQFINMYCTDAKPSYDDFKMKVEVTFKAAPFRADATGNCRTESTLGTTQLPTATTSVTNWA